VNVPRFLFKKDLQKLGSFSKEIYMATGSFLEDGTPHL